MTGQMCAGTVDRSRVSIC